MSSFTKKSFRHACLALVSFSLLCADPPPPNNRGAISPPIPTEPSPTNLGTYPFKLGAFQCIIIYDADGEYKPASLFVNAIAAELAPAITAFIDRAGKVHTPYAGLVVRTPENTVLIDTGAGELPVARPSHLLPNLLAAGIDPAQIDTILLTHGHLDHIGGTGLGHSQDVFPKARYVMFKQEWDFWMQDQPDLSTLSLSEATKKRFVDIARQQLRPLRDRMKLLEHDTEILPGIFALLAPGHTPGHMLVRLASQGQQLLYVSDLVLSPVALEHPAWHSQFELDVPLSQRTKGQMLARAADEKMLVYAMHFPWPGLGQVVADGTQWKWIPVATQP